MLFIVVLFCWISWGNLCVCCFIPLQPSVLLTSPVFLTPQSRPHNERRARLQRGSIKCLWKWTKVTVRPKQAGKTYERLKNANKVHNSTNGSQYGSTDNPPSHILSSTQLPTRLGRAESAISDTRNIQPIPRH